MTTMSPARADIDALMKRCQVGVGGGNALDNAHDIMAECYGTLGALMLEVERLRGLYEELLYSVGCKCLGETRHQTALRYIQQAEAPRISAAKREGNNVD